MDCWQAAIEDVGVAGVDRGAGGRYLVLPPGYAEAVPDGYLPLRSPTVHGFALLRSVLRSGDDADVAAAVAYARRVRVYPLGSENAASTVVEPGDEPFEAAIPYDSRFFEVLHAALQDEPWLERDRVMIDQIRTLGIARGTDFRPGEDVTGLLDDAAQEAHALLDARYERIIAPFTDDARWGVPAAPELLAAVGTGFGDPESYPVDDRGLTYTFAFFSARHLGSGQFYLMTTADADGRPLDGGATYRLPVPPHAPVTQYWSATVYDRETHTFLQGAERLGRSSQSPELTAEPDGSVVLTFGSSAPTEHDGNWTPTRVGHGFEVLFRFYGPTAALFDKTWRLPDLERVG
jgi:hypothetical protein